MTKPNFSCVHRAQPKVRLRLPVPPHEQQARLGQELRGHLRRVRAALHRGEAGAW